jgi:hypothetical protein
MRRGQRLAKGQPFISSSGLGIEPARMIEGSGASGSGRGTAASSAAV